MACSVPHALINSRLSCQIVIKARSKYINVADKMCEFNDSFMLYMTTRLPNPHLSPENQAKVNAATIITTSTSALTACEFKLPGKASAAPMREDLAGFHAVAQFSSHCVSMIFLAT